MKHDNMITRYTNYMAGVCRVTPEEFIKSRRMPLPDARAVIYRHLRAQGFTTIAIGRMFGKDHATITHGVKRINDLLKTDAMARRLYNKFSNYIHEHDNCN